MTRGGITYYYTFDGLGSVSELTDGNQNVVESYKYDAFGNLETPPATGNPYTYTGREYDSESGLYFYRARYYDVAVGRFITADPIGFEGGANFYAYVVNNPVNLIDPNGTFSLPWERVYGFCCGTELRCNGQSRVRDALDQACKEHDICWTTNHCRSWPCPVCDRPMCSKLLSSTSILNLRGCNSEAARAWRKMVFVFCY